VGVEVELRGDGRAVELRLERFELREPDLALHVEREGDVDLTPLGLAGGRDTLDERALFAGAREDREGALLVDRDAELGERDRRDLVRPEDERNPTRLERGLPRGDLGAAVSASRDHGACDPSAREDRRVRQEPRARDGRGRAGREQNERDHEEACGGGSAHVRWGERSRPSDRVPGSRRDEARTMTRNPAHDRILAELSRRSSHTGRARREPCGMLGARSAPAGRRRSRE
jgi:hypothetical protein